VIDYDAVMRFRPAVLALVLMLASSGCTAAPGSFVCEHCACYRGSTSLRQPVRCDTIGKEAQCCMLPSS
jgi:hypothetical protein